MGGNKSQRLLDKAAVRKLSAPASCYRLRWDYFSKPHDENTIRTQTLLSIFICLFILDCLMWGETNTIRNGARRRTQRAQLAEEQEKKSCFSTSGWKLYASVESIFFFFQVNYTVWLWLLVATLWKQQKSALKRDAKPFRTAD